MEIDESKKLSGLKRQYSAKKEVKKKEKNGEYIIKDKIYDYKDTPYYKQSGTIINIVDAIMGRGKSSSLINYINSSDENKRFLYITPYLEEVDRIKTSCINRTFYSPEITDKSGKIGDIKKLFKENKDIVSTHALFIHFDDEIVNLVRDRNYILVMDEVANVIKQLEITKEDSDTLIEKYIYVNEDGLIKWVVPDYTGVFEDYKKLCELECLSMYGGKIMIWLFPIKTFNAFKEIYMLTYMFDSQLQKYYYDYHGIEYKYMYIKGDTYETYTISDVPHESSSIYNFKNLINVIDNKKLNKIGDESYSLSNGWYEKNLKTEYIQKLKSNTYNFFKNYCDVKADELIWTTLKDYKKELSGKGYTKGFLSLNARATNKYQNTKAAAYLVNVYMNPFIKKFFVRKGIRVNEDKYALSELLQWLWRTQIRKGKPITVYIPSKRMRALLINWIEENSPKGE